MSSSQISYAHQTASQQVSLKIYLYFRVSLSMKFFSQPKNDRLLPKLLTEFIGTFFLVFTITLNVDENRPEQASFSCLVSLSLSLTSA